MKTAFQHFIIFVIAISFANASPVPLGTTALPHAEARQSTSDFPNIIPPWNTRPGTTDQPLADVPATSQSLEERQSIGDVIPPWHTRPGTMDQPLADVPATSQSLEERQSIDDFPNIWAPHIRPGTMDQPLADVPATSPLPEARQLNEGNDDVVDQLVDLVDIVHPIIGQLEGPVIAPRPSAA